MNEPGPGCGSLYLQQVDLGDPTQETGPSAPVDLDPGCGGGTPPPDPADDGFVDHFHHRDHLGSLRLVTDEAGGKVAGYDWYPYGLEMATTAGQAAASRWKYTVHERDEQTGLDSMWARYKPAYGVRFLSPDPADDIQLGDPQSWNKYVYVRNSVVLLIDPTGLMTPEACRKAGGTPGSGGWCHFGSYSISPSGKIYWHHTEVVESKPKKPLIIIDYMKIFFDSISTRLPSFNDLLGVGGGGGTTAATKSRSRDVRVIVLYLACLSAKMTLSMPMRSALWLSNADAASSSGSLSILSPLGEYGGFGFDLGVEAVQFRSGEFALYGYGGPGAGAPPGGNIAGQAGFIWGTDSSREYASGGFNSIQGTLTCPIYPGGVGVEATRSQSDDGAITSWKFGPAVGSSGGALLYGKYKRLVRC